MVDGQTLQQRSSLGHDVLVVACLRAKQGRLQRTRITNGRRAAVTLHQYRVHAGHVGYGQVIVSHNDLEVRLRANGIERLVLELRPEPVEQQEEALA